MIRGLFETHLNVSDLKRSAAFYEEIIGLELAHTDSRGVRFYWIGGRGTAMLGLWEKKPHEIYRQHFAFEVPLPKFTETLTELSQKGLQLDNFVSDGTGRPFVFGWMPAVSMYAEDPDGHSIEWLSMLPGEAKPELGVIPWEDWKEMHDRESQPEGKRGWRI
ncbi:VOC family protein [Paenibacillus sp. Marseille-Q4541]|uniref:VOC family protein n=1 Tax=Paenibacillus sp. Marseille-Q4541 TaxID=2831522 RepID=UPI001BACA61A|nr:VOC family protein [Paenibacillus sp. Marseille-Q4541]